MKQDTFVSPIFGPTRYALAEESALLDKYADEIPVSLFQKLNQRLNQRGLALMVTAVGEEH
ncbi:MAG: hypothetical protein DRI65_06100 [Chloroflexota bacterium]|nr:MAG: hypothetical protein DRI65_06100 [Chloroflexota bacterium]